MGIEEMRNRGVNAETVVWKAGMADWTKAVNVPELMRELQPASVQPQYPQQPVQPQYPQQNPYQQPVQQQYPQPNPYPQQQNPYQQNPYQQLGYEAPHTNWMPWAIVATVLGLCSLIPFVFGIVGIFKASKANNLYQQGATVEAESVNNSAKIFTFIALGLEVLSFIIGFCIGLAEA